jgi:hypothetical protein
VKMERMQSTGVREVETGSKMFYVVWNDSFLPIPRYRSPVDSLQC